MAQALGRWHAAGLPAVAWQFRQALDRRLRKAANSSPGRLLRALRDRLRRTSPLVACHIRRARKGHRLSQQALPIWRQQASPVWPVFESAWSCLVSLNAEGARRGPFSDDGGHVLRCQPQAFVEIAWACPCI